MQTIVEKIPFGAPLGSGFLMERCVSGASRRQKRAFPKIKSLKMRLPIIPRQFLKRPNPFVQYLAPARGQTHGRNDKKTKQNNKKWQLDLNAMKGHCRA